MNNPIKYLYLIPAGIVICTILSVISSCSEDDNPPGDNLPAGKYPMTFTTSVGELVVTRGTADNSQWAGTEEVAIQLGNDAASYGEIKEYKAATDGKLTPANNVPLYWRNTTETVTAWYPYSTARPTTFTVQPDQNTAGNYQTSDFLYTTGTYTYNSNGACALVFKHLPTKVVINLKGDTNGGITEDEIKGATVSIVNQSLTSGTIGDKGVVEAAAVAGTDAITPKELTTAAEGYQRSVQALLIPQVVMFTKFIKVTIDGSDYYYTPTDAVLNSGSQSTYNITVKKDGLEVSTLSGSWTDDDQSESIGDPETATFKIHLSKFTTPDKATAKITDGSGTVLTTNNGVYTTSSKTINITYTITDENYELQNFAPEVTAGIYSKPGKVIVNNDDYIYTLTDIRTDIWLNDIDPTTQLKVLKVGDYYYSDGSFSSYYNMGKTCIGIVFKAGAGDGDKASNYSGMSQIRGYVVALWDASDKQGGWGIRRTDESLYNWTYEGSVSNHPPYYDGYSNTKTIRNLGQKYTNTKIDSPLANGQYWAFKVASDYQPKDVTPAAPAGSSGWYLPSIKQLQDISTTEVRNKFSIVGGSDFNTVSNDHYWSSNEKNEYDAWFYSFSSTGSGGGAGTGAKSDDTKNEELKYWMTKDGGSKSYVRAVLTF